MNAQPKHDEFAQSTGSYVVRATKDGAWTVSKAGRVIAECLDEAIARRFAEGCAASDASGVKP